MAQYPIPQFIEEEGRIIFFLTFRQFFLLVGGGIVSVVLYFTVPFTYFVILSIPVMLFVVVIAFLKINNETLPKIFMHFIGFLGKNKTYTWNKKDLSYSDINTRTGQPVGPSVIAPEEQKGIQMQISKLKNIKKMIDTKK